MHVCKHCQAAMRGSFTDEDEEVQRNPTRLITGLIGRPAKLLDSASPKTALGEALGYTSLVMYLLPHFQLEDLMRQEQGLTMCPYASAGCAAGCLVGSGQGQFSPTQLSRARKTWLFLNDTAWFMDKLRREIQAARVKASQTIMLDPVTGEHGPARLCVRLNGTSDIHWEEPQAGVVIVSDFPDVQFYDYTKAGLSKRPYLANFNNYDLTYSMSETPASRLAAEEWLAAGRNVAVVWRLLDDVMQVVEMGHWMPPPVLVAGQLRTWTKPYPVIDGDRDDLRFLDPRGCVVALYAKVAAGRVMADPTGFFFERNPTLAAANGWAVPPEGARDLYQITAAQAAQWKLRLAGPMTKVTFIDPRTNVTKTISTQIDDRIQSTKPSPVKRKKAWLEHHFGPHYHAQLTEYGLIRHQLLGNIAKQPVGPRRFPKAPGPNHAGPGSAAALQDAQGPKRTRGSRLPPAALPSDMGEAHALFGEHAEQFFIIGLRVIQSRKGHMRLTGSTAAALKKAAEQAPSAKLRKGMSADERRNLERELFAEKATAQHLLAGHYAWALLTGVSYEVETLPRPLRATTLIAALGHAFSRAAAEKRAFKPAKPKPQPARVV